MNFQNTFHTNSKGEIEYHIGYEAMKILRESNKRKAKKEKSMSLEELSKKFGTKMEYLSDSNANETELKQSSWNEDEDQNKKKKNAQIDQFIDIYSTITEKKEIKTLKESENKEIEEEDDEDDIPETWEEEIDDIDLIQDEDEEANDWNMPMLLVNKKEFYTKVIKPTLSDSQTSMIDYDAVIQDYIDQHYDQFEDEYYSQYMIFETSSKYIPQSKKFLYLQTGYPVTDFKSYYTPSTIYKKYDSTILADELYQHSGFQSASFMKSLLVYTNKSLIWRYAMMKEIDDESDKQIFYRSRCLENMMKELMNLRQYRLDKQAQVKELIEKQCTTEKENVEKNVMIFQLNQDIKTIDRLIEENMKKMDTSYQTISRNFFKDLFASKEEDVKFDLSVYTKQYSSIHNLYSTLFNGFQDFDHLTRLETIFLQILYSTPQQHYQSEDEYMTSICMYREIIQYLWLIDFGRLPL